MKASVKLVLGGSLTPKSDIEMAASTVMDASYDRKRYVRKPACVNCQTFVAEAVTIFEDLYSTARRVFGSSHPLVGAIKRDLEWAIQYDLLLARKALIAAKARKNTG